MSAAEFLKRNGVSLGEPAALASYYLVHLLSVLPVLIIHLLQSVNVLRRTLSIL